MGDSDSGVRQIVARRIDPSRLPGMMEDDHWSVRWEAARRIDPSRIPEMMGDPDLYVRRAVAERIDPSRLPEMKEAKDLEIVARRKDKDMEKTTDLATVRQDWDRFACGQVTRIIYITPAYTIVCYSPTGSSTSFRAYVGGKDTGCSASSVEGAMLIAIAYGSTKTDQDPMARAAAKLLEVEL